jgi:hypothetical protein
LERKGRAVEEPAPSVEADPQRSVTRKHGRLEWFRVASSKSIGSARLEIGEEQVRPHCGIETRIRVPAGI